MKVLKKHVQVAIPTMYGDFDFIAYAASSEEKMPHLALVAKNTDFGSIVNVRIHSECMTGDLFGSKRCECGEQLKRSMQYISGNGGIIIYLRQEGRGIGLINKLHAYIKQEEGYDTAEANKILGFEYDERSYEDAISILLDLGVSKINLITNNPNKVKAFELSNILMAKRIEIEIDPNIDNKNYLKIKKIKFGHLISKI